MTDTDTSVDATPAPEEFASSGALDEWIDGATVAKRSVPIYGNPGLYAEYEDLERKLSAAKLQAEVEDESLGDAGVQEVEQQMRVLLEKFRASKATWTVRALADEDFKAIRAAVDWPTEPKEPKEPDEKDPEKARMLKAAHEVSMAAYEAELKEYEEQMAALGDQVNLEILAKAVCDITFADGRRSDGVTVEQLQRLRKKLGERQLLTLIQTSQRVTYEEPKVPAPFSPATTRDGQT